MSKSKRPLRTRSDYQVLETLSQALVELADRGYDFLAVALEHCEYGDKLAISCLETDGPQGRPNVRVNLPVLVWDEKALGHSHSEEAQEDEVFFFRGMQYTKKEFLKILADENPSRRDYSEDSLSDQDKEILGIH